MSAPPEELNLSQAQWMRAPKRWPLVNTLGSRDGQFFKDARLINCYAEKDKQSGEYEVEKRPGFAITPVIASVPSPYIFGQGISATTVFQAGIPLSTSSQAINPGKFTYVIYILNNALYEAIYNSTGGLVVAPHRLVSVQISQVAGQTPSKANFLPIEGGSLSVNGRTNENLVLFGGGMGNWQWTNFNGLVQVQGGPLAYIYLGANAVESYVSTVYVLTPAVALGGYNLLNGVLYIGYPLSTVPGFAILNGFIYVMDTSGVIYQSANQNDPSDWSGIQTITAASDSDVGVQLARQLVYIVAIKTFTTQFFYDAGNTVGSNLSPLPGAVYNIGCLSADTFADLDGVLFWVSQSRGGTNEVVMVKNLNLTTISNKGVERFLEITPSTQWYAFAYQHVGHQFYVLTNVTANKTLVYDITEGLWYVWTDYLGNSYPVVARCTGPLNAEWQQTIQSGSVYAMGADYLYPTDFGYLFPVDIYTPNFDAGVDRVKVLSQMRFEADKVAGSQLQIRYSDDDYGTWNNFRTLNLNSIRPILTDEGSFYRRAYHLRHNRATAFRIRAIDLQMDIGTL